MHTIVVSNMQFVHRCQLVQVTSCFPLAEVKMWFYCVNQPTALETSNIVYFSTILDSPSLDRRYKTTITNNGTYRIVPKYTLSLEPNAIGWFAHAGSVDTRALRAPQTGLWKQQASAAGMLTQHVSSIQPLRLLLCKPYTMQGRFRC